MGARTIIAGLLPPHDYSIYWCLKCEKNHQRTSKIGQKHIHHEKYLCRTCEKRDGSCSGTSYGGTVMSCHSYVFAKKNKLCSTGLHNWSFPSSCDGVLVRDCRRCYQVQFTKDGLWRDTDETLLEVTHRLLTIKGARIENSFLVS